MRKKMHSSSENISKGDSLSPSDLYRIGMQNPETTAATLPS